MRISDWSSDVCSSDLDQICRRRRRERTHRRNAMKYRKLGHGLEVSAIGIGCMPLIKGGNILYGEAADVDESTRTTYRAIDIGVRSEERRVGKECVRTCRSRWSAVK